MSEKPEKLPYVEVSPVLVEAYEKAREEIQKAELALQTARAGLAEVARRILGTHGERVKIHGDNYIVREDAPGKIAIRKVPAPRVPPQGPTS